MDSNITEDLRKIAVQMQALRDTAYTQYRGAVEAILADDVINIESITAVLDGLCDWCDEDRFVDLYRSVCKHIYSHDPELVGEYAALYRALWATNDGETERC